MKITSELIEQLYNMINTEDSRRSYTYIPPLDIRKSVEAFLKWLEKNGYMIIKKDKEKE